MKHIVNFSGGLCSFWAAKRVIEQHGTKDVILLFADTLEEDEELYVFNQQAAIVLGVPITVIGEGIGIWELFRKQGIIGNSRFPICSVYLKREPLDRWHMENALEMDSILYLGFDHNEAHRLADIRREKPNWRIEAPMTEAPYWDKCEMEREAVKLGLIIPRLYKMGFPHNNCGGTCVRAGISHWVHLYNVLPQRFAKWEHEEKVTIKEFETRGIKGFSILKDRRGGVYNQLTLETLRKRIEAGEKFSKYDWGGCGCGGAKPQEFEEPKGKVVNLDDIEI